MRHGLIRTASIGNGCGDNEIAVEAFPDAVLTLLVDYLLLLELTDE